MTSNNDQKFYVSSGCISYHFYDNFIKNKIYKSVQKLFEALLEDNEEDLIEYYRVSIDNPDDREWEYSCLWFFDINLKNGKYMPVYVSGINTKSSLAGVMCEMDREEDEEEDNTKTLEELLDYVPNGNEEAKETFKKLLLFKKE